MRIIVQSKTLPVTQALQAFIRHQSQKLAKITGRIGQLSVFLEKVAKKSNDPTAASVKYWVQLPGRKAVVVTRHAVDMYEAIVDVTKRAMRQVLKVKEKRMGQMYRVNGRHHRLPEWPK